MKVTNMRSNRGNLVPNQFIITDDQGDAYFQSYQTAITKKTAQGVVLDPKWDYSKTTGTYRNQFLGETRTATEKKIKSGQYTVTDLNTNQSIKLR